MPAIQKELSIPIEINNKIIYILTLTILSGNFEPEGVSRRQGRIKKRSGMRMRINHNFNDEMKVELSNKPPICLI
jgi:hypothetical protein